MMTARELMPQIVQLPLNERLLVLEALMRSVREELFAEQFPQTVTPFETLRGLLKPDGPMPTDEELLDDYTDYLVRKYA